MIRRVSFIFLFLLGFGVTHGQDNSVVHTVFFIGDGGEPFVELSPIGKVLRQKVSQTHSPSAVIYLGDNVYPKGLPPVGSSNRVEMEAILKVQAGWIAGLNTQGIFIPGNHDWQKGGREGLERIQSQARFIDSLGQENLKFLPQNGCPGPFEVPLSESSVLIIIDTQWFLHPFDKPDSEGQCDAKLPGDVYAMVEDIFSRNKDKRVIIAAHHPPITYGEHGGVVSWKEHLFPLTQANKNLYLPLPIIGSIAVGYRKWIGNIQDIAHPIYKDFSYSIQEVMKKYPGNIYAAGHEHALEYIVKDSSYFIVSGSGAKTTYVKKKKYAKLAQSVNGFVEVSVRKDGSTTIKYWQADNSYPDGKVIFTDSLPAIKSSATSPTDLTDLSKTVVRVKASDEYTVSKTKEKYLGVNYRKEWATEIDVPVFNMSEEMGGLKPLQKGGGMQTLSLRLEDKSGREFVIRSVEKYPEKAVPEMFRKTFGEDLVQDQISASHPYAALVVPSLAEAAGIYHTNPRLTYVPDDPALGDYRKDFANRLVLFEERPAGDWSDKAFFGNSKKIVNTSKVLESLQKDNDGKVDQPFVVQSRIFDLWIGDWDRHDDQWRWATLGSKKEEIYRPIPRDRDQAFFLNQGRAAKLWSRRWALPKFEGFDEYIKWPSGLSFNARYFDRSFLNELSKDQWIDAANELSKRMTDSVIEKSIQAWPPEIIPLHGNEIIKNLKARREGLIEAAISHYNFLAKEVDVVGSDKAEWFEVERKENGDVLVMMSKITKENEKGRTLYQRLFKEQETDEVRLFGRGGDDVFNITGKESNIRIRIIGGDGKDAVTDASEDGRTYFYDLKGQGEVVNWNSVKNRMSYNPSVNVYDRKSFKYNKLAPLIYGNYNRDDGIFVGGGFVSFNHGFRKEPFKSRHFVLASIAPLTQSYNFMYKGRFTEAIGKWDFEAGIDLKTPNFTNNFFGMGNETVFDEEAGEPYGAKTEISYYRFRFKEILIKAGISRRLGRLGDFKVGPIFQRIKVDEPSDQVRYLDVVYAPTLDYNLYSDAFDYAGLGIQYHVERRNDPLFTARGAVFDFSSRTMAGLDNQSSTFSSVEGSFSLFQSFRIPARTVFALRVGGGHNFGDYEFYQAQVLDGKSELRGFRKTRFYGDSRLYTNLEMRIKLANVKSYLFPASLGILAFTDGGRVWYSDGLGDPSASNGKSTKWHTSWGGGFWFTPFNFAVLSAEVGHSTEGNLGYIRLGFLF